jgi:hypothetical protein
MSDALIFVLVFGGLMILRLVAATVVFVLILPRGNRCPLCDATTASLAAPVIRALRIPLTHRWCLACGWDGYMRTERQDLTSAKHRGRQARADMAKTLSHDGQLPLRSKKSSK